MKLHQLDKLQARVRVMETTEFARSGSSRRDDKENTHMGRSMGVEGWVRHIHFLLSADNKCSSFRRLMCWIVGVNSSSKGL